MIGDERSSPLPLSLLVIGAKLLSLGKSGARLVLGLSGGLLIRPGVFPYDSCVNPVNIRAAAIHL